MSAVIKKFVAPHGAWMRRWTDPKMAPWCAPFFVGDRGRAGVVVGPYVSERFEMREEFVPYPSWEVCARELNLQHYDLRHAGRWIETLLGTPEMAPVVPRVRLSLEGATTSLRAGKVLAYAEEMLGVTRALIAAFAPLAGVTLSPAAVQRLALRDAAVAASASAVLRAETEKSP